MDAQTAIGYAGRLYGAFPGRSIPDTAIALAGEEFATWDGEVVRLAVNELQDSYNPPSLAQVREALRDAKAVLVRVDGPPLPAEGTWTDRDIEQSEVARVEAFVRWRAWQSEVNEDLNRVAKFATDAEEFTQRAPKREGRGRPPGCIGETAVWSEQEKAMVCGGCGARIEPLQTKSVPSPGGDR